VIEHSGFDKLKEARDALIFRFVRPLPPMGIAWNPNNVGPLYFLVVLTLGVLIPSLRCVLVGEGERGLEGGLNTPCGCVVAMCPFEPGC
jgi:hypothetical protein